MQPFAGNRVGTTQAKAFALHITKKVPDKHRARGEAKSQLNDLCD
jgi:hypothetical protein